MKNHFVFRGILNKTRRRILFIIISIPILLLSVNGYISLYCEEKAGFAGTVTLCASGEWEDRDDKILGEAVDLKFAFKIKRLYNSEFYEGTINLSNDEYNSTYNVIEERFYPRSFFGKIYNDFKYLWSIKESYSLYSFNIDGLPYSGYDAYISYSPTADVAYMNIYKDEELLIAYRSAGF